MLDQVLRERVDAISLSPEEYDALEWALGRVWQRDPDTGEWFRANMRFVSQKWSGEHLLVKGKPVFRRAEC